MPLKQTRRASLRRAREQPAEPDLFAPPDPVEPAGPSQTLPAAAVLSFLKDSRGALSWNIRDLRKSLNIGKGEAARVIAVLQLQGYAAPGGGSGEWLTTQNGNIVSGSKEPRFAREMVLQAISELSGRMQAVNKDLHAPYRVQTGVAYGDFLSGRERVQAADVGIQLAPRTSMKSNKISARGNAAQRAFLRVLRNKNARLALHPYGEWMSARSHRKLL
jgi:hypothetical protein